MADKIQTILMLEPLSDATSNQEKLQVLLKGRISKKVYILLKFSSVLACMELGHISSDSKYIRV